MFMTSTYFYRVQANWLNFLHSFAGEKHDYLHKTRFWHPIHDMEKS